VRADLSVSIDRRRGTTARSRLVGRDDVLRELDLLVSGPWDVPPATIVLEGAPGLGKTALVNTVSHHARRADVRVLRARGARQETNSTFGVLEQFVAQIQAEEPISERARAMMRQPEATAASDRDLVELFRSLETTLFDMVPRRPVLVAVDDVHWCDPASIAFLHYLVRRVEIHQVRFVMSMVPRHARLSLTPLDRLLHESSARRLTLQPLTLVDVEEFLVMTLGVSSDTRVAAEYHHATGGNPFLLSALLSDIDRRHPPGVDELLLRLEGDALPEVVRALAHGLEPLSPEARHALEAAVVLGNAATAENIAELIDATPESVEAAATTMLELGLVKPGWPLRLEHPLVASTVHRLIPTDRRQQAHERAATLLAEAGAPLRGVAHHLAQTAPSGDASRASSLADAARLAEAEGDVTGAHGLFSRALAEPPESGPRVEMLLEMALVEARLRHPSVVDRLDEALRIGADPASVGRATLGVLWHTVGTRSATGVLDAMDAARSQLDEDDHELALHLALAADLFDPHLDTRQAPIDDADLDAAGPTGRMWRMRRVGADADALADDLDAATTVKLLNSAWRGAELPHRDLVDLVVVAHSALTLLRAGSTDAGLAMLEELRSVTQAAGDPQAHRVALSLLLHAHVLRDDLTAALSVDVEASEIGAAPYRAFDAATVAWRHELALLTGGAHHDLPHLTTQLTAVVERSHDIGSFEPFAAAEQLGWSRLRRGDRSDALEAFRRAQRSAERALVRSPAVTEWRAGQALASAALGDAVTARRLADRQLELARQYGAPRTTARALRVVAQVGPEATRVPLLAEAAELLAPTGLAVERAATLIDLGEAIRASGDPVAARRPLRAAADLAVRSGASALVDRSRAELRASGARPRRMAITGLESLTPAERRVVDLAARGASNADIAGQLFISVKTVESHLAHAYRKLGISSRAALRELLSG
jgi:DNA-binding CsgD family transcriptional regulator